MEALRRTSLHPRHAQAGARFGGFAGWEMPLHYGSPREEHMAVRRAAGLFDVSHMGQLEVSGPDARAFLAHALTNDITAVGPGQGQYTLMLDDDGGVVDDLIAYALLDRFLLVVNAANVAACAARLQALALGREVQVADRTHEVAMLALQGPGWEAALRPLVATPAPLTLEYFEVTEDAVAGVPALVARTGYTGEPGVEMLVPWSQAPRVWDALTRGADGATPAGLVARDTLRTEMGYPLYGQELTAERTPVEAGLRWACDLERARFAGAPRLVAQVAEGTPERLCAFVLEEPGIPRPGQAVLAGGSAAGVVTSGTLSPVLEAGIGMAYVRADLAAPDTAIAIDVRGKHKRARVARRPLVDTSPRKG
ncbi:MAG TPA: glycine cleavage system aminomethyltransferase GcvT [Miltoncostaeaceae bacterium]|nr:glycine cleavage system aminomethyltransferase GcvT [Miltoncostaeaceae bacterium]